MTETAKNSPDDNVRLSDADWRTRLSPESFRITREHGTEPPHSHPLNKEMRAGTYRCVCCSAALFPGKTKYDSGTGWPSFFAPHDPTAVSEHEDKSLFRRRTEVRCARCEAHLGHVFSDGLAPTGRRYCMNGTALEFVPDAGADT